MAILNIKDPEAHALASEIARRTGQTLTKVVTETLRERLARENSKSGNQSRLVARVLEIGHRAASRPVLDPRTPDEILGYDEHGVPRL
ncbi:MAG TPA: type II toxin-antitoxin system VapB family antitoxin [Bryobacteraceae bacterium]|jgi:antitoxin VapB|nr:type II toxin-antitoxin system VapB family antitoxin [Bryobacteraceae bacterium]